MLDRFVAPSANASILALKLEDIPGMTVSNLEVRMYNMRLR